MRTDASRRILISLIAFALAVAWTVAAAPLARADGNDTPSSWSLNSYHITATPAKDGGLTMVVLDMAFDFASDAGHGPYVVLPERMRVKGDQGVWRNLDVRVLSATSSTGANTAMQTKHDSGALVLRLGSEGHTYTGVQQYTITYQVHGIVYPNNPESGLDEFNWNAVGPGSAVPMDDVRVTVKAPAQATRTACFTGSGFGQACTAPAAAQTMTWVVPHLNKGVGLQVVAGFPQGTFTNAAFHTSKRYYVGNTFPLTPVTAGGAAVVALAAIAGVIGFVRRRGADQTWAGTIPGLAPRPGDAAGTTRRGTTTTTVAFRPPKGVRPGEVGTLMDERADLHDVTATIIDLAVRGHLHIDAQDAKTKTFTLTQGKDEMAPYEAQLLGNLFAGQSVVSTDDLSDASKADVLPQCQTALYARVSNPPLQWFKGNPKLVRTLWVAVGICLAIVGGMLTMLAALAGFGLVPLGIVVAGVLLAALSGTMPSRTPAGTAVHEEAKGFRLYLTTAEADQIKFEEGIDVFSRYLPYAIVFGVADRWVTIFDQLAREGRYTPDYGWYGGWGYGYGFAAGSFSDTFSSLTDSMQSSVQASMAAANQSSSGGSGFSGGGGAGGVSVGGW